MGILGSLFGKRKPYIDLGLELLHRLVTTLGEPGNDAPVSVEAQVAKEKAMQDAIAKYKELYLYSTDVLLKEHDRFSRADDKASKYSTMFIFLIGVLTYFEKWAFDRIVKNPEGYVDLPTEWPVLVVGALALILSGVGWFLASRVIMLRPYESRPLNKEMLEFFAKQSLLDIYGSIARRTMEAYQKNLRGTDEKYTLLVRAHRILVLVLILLAELLILYSLYSIF